MRARKISPLAFASILTLLVYVGIFMRIPIVPLYAKSLGASTVEVGLIAFSFMIIAAALAIPLGSLSDRLGRKRLIFAGLVLSSFASFLLSISQTPKQLMLVYALAGLGAAAFAPAMASFVGDTSTGRIGRAYGWYTSAMQAGMAAGPAAGGFIASYMSYSSAFFFSGAVIFLALLLCLNFPASTIELKPGNIEIKKLLQNKVVFACWMATFCIAFAFGTFQPFFPLYASTIGIGIFYIGLLFAIQSFFNAFARIPAGYISDRWGKRRPFIVIGMLLFAIGIILLASTADWYFILTLVALVGLTMGVATMAVSTSLAEAVHPASRGMAMGGFSTTLYGGFAISSLIGGKIISSFGYFYGFLAGGLVCALGALLFYAIER